MEVRLSSGMSVGFFDFFFVFSNGSVYSTYINSNGRYKGVIETTNRYT
jgi:hypothetical protein